MAGTVWLALASFAGLDVSGESVSIMPALPAHWRSMQFNIGFRGRRYHLEVDHGQARIRADGDVEVRVGDETVALRDGTWTTINT